jgi:hypothetical protein
MLALKLGISLPSLRSLEWEPTDEGGLVAWYRINTGLTLVGAGVSPLVSAWADSSPNSYDMAQGTSSEQPFFTSSDGSLTFASATKENLQTSGQISLSDDFTIGIRCFPSAFSNTIIGDNTTTNEFFKFTSNTNFRIKIDGSTVNIGLDSGTFGDDVLIITRRSDDITLYKNGVEQSSVPTLAGTADIDAIGIRAVDTDGYDGTIKEIQIYNNSTEALIDKIYTRLKDL